MDTYWEDATSAELEAAVRMVVAAVRTFPDEASFNAAVGRAMADPLRARTFMAEVSLVVGWGIDAASMEA
ncbi:MAG: hypothetical protein JWN67_430 [Actinomycetia bacterium]|nr:hypothetical protein [Actinomycetes bacterium]